eukprot:1592865-Pyramimonas_sp.AAC.1
MYQTWSVEQKTNNLPHEEETQSFDEISFGPPPSKIANGENLHVWSLPAASFGSAVVGMSQGELQVAQ